MPTIVRRPATLGCRCAKTEMLVKDVLDANPGITPYGEACVKTALLLNVHDLRIDVGAGTIQKGDLPGLRLGLEASASAPKPAVRL